MTDRRAVFFAFAALVCFALIPLAESKYRDVTLIVAIVYVVLCVASALDHRSRRRS
jgi:TRAP-type uncharacterized transport system fused permease subunit